MALSGLSSIARRGALAAAIAAVAAPAGAMDGPPPPPSKVDPRALAPSDPLEGMNRRLFAVDKAVNRLFAGKSVIGSAKFLPQPVRTGLYNFFNNLDEPATMANDVLQQRWKRAAVSGGRFVTNSTVGVLGTIDVASRLGLRRHREDFGQTMARYGITPGPYVYIPLSGPTTFRDKLGDKVDGFARPLGWVEMDSVVKTGIRHTNRIVQPHVLTIRERARMAAEAGETEDEYAYLRELYFAQRAAEIENAPGSDDYITPVAPPPAPGVTPVDGDEFAEFDGETEGGDGGYLEAIAQARADSYAAYDD